VVSNADDNEQIDIDILQDEEELDEAQIPKFDLSEQMMAEQRKITALKRKAPGAKVETQNEEIEISSSNKKSIKSKQPSIEYNQIIAEIVARDIEKLCRGK